MYVYVTLKNKQGIECERSKYQEFIAKFELVLISQLQEWRQPTEKEFQMSRCEMYIVQCRLCFPNRLLNLTCLEEPLLWRFDLLLVGISGSWQCNSINLWGELLEAKQSA